MDRASADRAGGGFGGGQRGQVVPVRVVPATKQNLDVYLRALGTVTPINTVTVRTRLDGELVKVNFTEGQRVAKGQLLAEIDTRPYQVQLSQAQGALEENKARLRNAETDLERYQKLQQEQLITAQQVVGQEAQVRQLNGAIQSSEAQVASARLNLNYARIIAPIDGKLGLRQVDAGNMVRSGDQNGIVVITQMRPISVIFTVPETELPPVLEAMRADRRLARRGLGSRRRRQAGDRCAADRRQPDRHGDRHHQAARDLRERRRVAVPEPVRQHPAARADAPERDDDPGRGGAARGLRRVRLHRQARPGAHRLDPAGHARADRGRARRGDERPGAAGAGRARRRRPADRRRQGRDRSRRRRAGGPPTGRRRGPGGQGAPGAAPGAAPGGAPSQGAPSPGGQGEGGQRRRGPGGDTGQGGGRPPRS